MALDKTLNTDLSSLAQVLRNKGRGKDTILAHITPQEAALLKRRGGRGSINPDTGLPEFDTVDVGGQGGEGAYNAPSGEVTYQPPTPEQTTTPIDTTNFGQQFNYQPSGYLPSAVQMANPQQYGTFTSPTAPTPTFAGEQTPATPEAFGAALTPEQQQVTKDASQQPSGVPDFLKKAGAALTKPETLGRLGLAGALGAYGAYQSSQAGKAADQATAQRQAIAQPYQQQGQQLVGAAQRGELTAANQQVIQQQRARLAQSVSNMGGVGAQQVESQIANLTTQLLQNQYQYGLQVMQIGDNIALGAINSQLQADTQLANANKQFYSSLAQLAAGSPMYIPGITGTAPKVG